MSLNTNIVANYIGSAWVSLMSLLFIPLYIKYMGIEAYGLIGIYAMLQAWLTLTDMGLTPTLSREMARFTGGEGDTQYIHNLLRSVTTICCCIGLVIAICIWLGSVWFATNWFKVETLPISVLAQALSIMGIVSALRFIEGIYRSAIVGLQRQIILNITSCIMETLRGLGAVGVLVFISPTVQAFFIWQAIISIATLLAFVIIVYTTLPKSPIPATFSFESLKNIRSFASGMMLTTLLALLMTQVDKLFLSRLLTLEKFGLYTLAFVVANAAFRLAGPVTQAIFPHFVELAARGDQAGLAFIYHRGSQLVTVLMGTAVIILMNYTNIILSLWNQNIELSNEIKPLIIILSIGVFLNGIMQIPVLLQYAHNWISLSIKTNAITICFILPSIIILVPIYGVYGAAWIWVAINSGYVLFMIGVMHRKILKTEKWKWYFQDVAIPFLAALLTAWMLKLIWPSDLNVIEKVTVLVISSGLTLLVSLGATPILRREMISLIFNKINTRKI